jgi:elongation factor G
MKRFDLEKIRNVALIGHGGSGKTSLGEAMLFASNTSKRLGKVDDDTSVLNFEPEEKSHKLTISTSIATFEYAKHKITLLDTPGYDVFLYDSFCALEAADSAILVVGADGEIKFEAEKMWARCAELNLPRSVFISKLDKDNTDFDATVANLVDAFPDSTFVTVQRPIGAQSEFTGYIDLLKMKAFTFTDESGKGAVGKIPAELADEAQVARDEMVEILVETDDALMERFFEGDTISDEDLITALRKGIALNMFVPVTCGNSVAAVGTTALLDMITDSLPSPASRGPIVIEGANGEREFTADENGPLAAIVFKTISDPFAGRLNLFRVISGKMTPDASFWNSTHETEERIGQMVSTVGKDTTQMTEAGPGDIFAVPKLKATRSGETFCDKKAGLKIPFPEPPEALMSFAVFSKNKGDEDKMGQGLKRIIDEDPTLRLSREPQTHEMIVSCMGRLHIDINLERMKRKYNADVVLRTPKVPYRETIKGSTKVQGRHKKQSGGRGQFADTWIEIKPLKRGGDFEFVNKIVGGSIPRQYIPAVEAGVKERLLKGVIAGYPMVDVQVTLYDGKYHDVDSSEMAFKIAGSLGFKKGALECKPVLLEPIQEMIIRVPDENLGDVIGDLNSRRGRVLGMEPGTGVQEVKAHVPLSEVQAYAPDLRSMSSGRGTFSMHFDHYEEIPAQLAEKVISESKLEDAEE